MKLSLSFLFCCLMTSLCLQAQTDTSRPNVIFILADDLGWSDTTLYGGTTFYRTPNLDRLAKRGLTFTRAYSASPLCSPTRASILTGQHPARLGITAPVCHLPEELLTATLPASALAPAKVIEPRSATRLPTSVPTLATLLREAGYSTAHFGKWHLGPEPYSPLQHGFETDLPHHSGPGPAGSYVAPWKFLDFDPKHPGEHIEDRMAGEAVAWMEKHRDKPFFLNYWQFSVHAPFNAKKTLVDKYRALADPANHQHCPTYAAMVESMDEAVGKLLDAVDRLGLAERTIIVFFSDNGGNMYDQVDGGPPTSNAPLRGGKATVYEGGVRVPCVVAWPGLTRPGSRTESLLQSTDFFPTFAELLHLAVPRSHHLDGVSQGAVLRGGPPARENVFTYFPHSPKVPETLPPALSVTGSEWKLIRLFHQGEKGAHIHLLYNLKDDPGETRDLAVSEPGRVATLAALLDKFVTETKPVLPAPNPARTSNAAVADPLHGWKVRNGSGNIRDGLLTVSPNVGQTFLGFSAARFKGPATLSFRLRSGTGGAGKVEWLPTPTANDTAKSEAFATKPGEWSELSATIPETGPLGIVRLYLPGAPAQADIDWIELKPAGGKPVRFDF